jgi:hypothetical protein
MSHHKKEAPNDYFFTEYFATQARIIDSRQKFLQSIIESCKPIDKSIEYILKQEIRTVPLETDYEPQTVRCQRVIEQYRNSLSCYTTILQRFRKIYTK